MIGLFFDFLHKIWMILRVSNSLPMTGENSPNDAAFTILVQYFSRTFASERSFRVLTFLLPRIFLNEETAKGVKDEGGVVVHHVNDVEIMVLPKDLPEYLEVDIANLSVGDTIHLTDLNLPEGVELVELTKGEDHDQAVVSITAPRVEKEESEDEAPAADEVPAANEKDADE